jgi:hypothetical protein
LSGKSPLPAGCRFHIWPRYLLEVGDRAVYLSPSQAEVLLLLLSVPGRIFSALEIGDTLYSERENGGPEFAQNHVRKQVHDLVKRCRDAGIDLRLKNPLTNWGYSFMGVDVLESPKATLERMGVRLDADRRAFSRANFRTTMGLVR